MGLLRLDEHAESNSTTRSDTDGSWDLVGRNLVRTRASQMQTLPEVGSKKERPKKRDNRETISPTNMQHNDNRARIPRDTTRDSTQEPGEQELEA